ncbi:MAG: hypothetical protein LBF72_02970 [Holosporales bacterium]|jgi:hypothetical protein|nr:hypothetical protein [Holosporales bacterium]
MFFFKAKTLGRRAAAILISSLSLKFYIAGITVQATGTTPTMENIIWLLGGTGGVEPTDVASSLGISSLAQKERDKFTRIRDILSEININYKDKFSSYRREQIYKILNEDKLSDSGPDYSIRELLKQTGALGFDGSPIGLATVNSRLNEICNLLIRSLVTDSVGETTDVSLKDGFTIFSKLNYIRKELENSLIAGDSELDSLNEPIHDRLEDLENLSSLLTFIKWQLFGTAYMLTKDDIFGWDRTENNTIMHLNGIIDEISEMDAKLKTLSGTIASDDTTSETDKYATLQNHIYAIYNILVPHIKASVTGLSVEDLNVHEDTVINVFKIGTQLNDVKALVGNLNTSALPLHDLSGIARSANYLFPLIKSKINTTNQTNWDKILVGGFAQQGLTLMNCLHNIRKDFLAEITATGGADVTTVDRELFEKNPCLWALELPSSEDRLPENFSVANLYSCIKSIATDSLSAQTEQEEKSYLARLLSPTFIPPLTITDIPQANFANYYNYSELITLLLCPNTNNEKKEKIEVFSSPLIKALKEQLGATTFERVKDIPWFTKIDTTDAANYFNFLKQMLTEGAIHISAELFDRMQAKVSDGPKEVYDEFFNDAKTYLGSVESAIPDTTEFSQLKGELQVISTSFPDCGLINISNVIDKCKELETYISQYNSTTPALSVLQRALLLGTPQDHPADITIWGAYNGILYENGAQILINHVGSYSDPGYASYGTLYSILRQVENELDSYKTADWYSGITTIRQNLGKLVGAIGYKYKSLNDNYTNTLDKIYTGTDSIKVKLNTLLTQASTPVNQSDLETAIKAVNSRIVRTDGVDGLVEEILALSQP